MHLLTSSVYILGDLTDRALGWWAGCGEGVVFRVCWECVVCCERRVVQGFFGPTPGGSYEIPTVSS